LHDALGDQLDLFLALRDEKRGANRRRRNAVPAHLLRKIETPSGLQLEFVRCSRTPCRCARGELHGPYLSLRWREDGRQRRRYVPRRHAEAVRMAIASWRADNPSVRGLRRLLAAVRRLERGELL